jgi:hypothetical protein
MIDDDSIFCQHCGQNQSGKVKKQGSGRKTIGIVICVLSVFLIIGAMAGESEPEKIGTDPQAVADLNVPAQEIFTVGDVVELNNIHVTLRSVTESTGAQFFMPDDGNVFLICEFNIENYSTSDVAVSSLMCFEAYVDDYAVNMDLSATASANKTQLDGTVASGKKMSGVIGYQVPENWEEIEIRFTPDFWSGKDIIFTCSK